jgi:hypothetical protein
VAVLRTARAKRARLNSGLLAAALGSATLAACDETFVPLQPLETELSIFGYLDASADTQWVRVTRIRPLATTTRTPLDGLVSAEHLGNGQVLEFRDSLIWYRTADVGGEGVYLNNFWTAERVEPGSTYRFAVAREGKPTAEALIEIPPEFEIELALRQHNLDTTFVILEGVRHLAFVDLITRLEDDCGPWTHRNRLREILSLGDVQRVVQTAGEPIRSRPGCGALIIWGSEYRIVASGEEWPTGVDYLTGRLSVLDAPSNIRHAIGFLAGVLTRTIPSQSCALLSQPFGSMLPNPPVRGEHCRVRFDESRAILRGVAIDAQCPDRPPIQRMSVILEEIEPGPNGLRERRAASTNPIGEFAIHGIHPGTRYMLSLMMQDQYDPHAVELEFEAGESRFLEIDMVRRSLSC